MKNKIQFGCETGTIFLPLSDDCIEEHKEGKPVIRRIFIHGDHAHLIRIDPQGDVRNNEIFELYENNGLVDGTISINMNCEKCKQDIQFKIVLPTQKSEESIDEFGVPTIPKLYQCIHVHSDNNTKHANHLRIKPDGTIKSSKFYPIIIK
jgi:hypothetical protein